ncbi:MAG: alpha-glucan family phosphorylase [Verrucomicrobiia bacterium]
MNDTPISRSEVTELINGLNKLARNMWWTWNQEAQELFAELSPRAWQNLYHNAVAILHEVSDYELRVRLQDPEFAARVKTVLKLFDNYINEKNTWASQYAPQFEKNPVAYFSAEFGFHESLPIAAGGLGILSGDHTKSASDLGLGFIGVSLFYREGYFMQSINQDNWQTEYYSRLNPKNLAMEPVLNAMGEPVVCSVEIDLANVYFQAWRVNVGRCYVILLDTDRPENDERFRELASRVYGGDSTTRIMQEILLGIGGVRMLRALGIQPSVFHLNEGHPAFLILELIREKLAEGKSLEEAIALTREECVFTTHTPVEAGHDRFPKDLMEYALHKYLKTARLSIDTIMEFGRVDPKNQNEPFCMTVLALKHCRAANAVSELHGRVSRQMWHSLYPNLTVDKVPIGHITNGIHLMGWMKGPVRRFWRKKFSAIEPSAPAGETTTFWTKKPSSNWEFIINSEEFWKKIEDPNFISDEEIWALRYRLRRELIEFVRRRLLIQEKRLQQDFIAYDNLLNPDALTIGFARRFATYKRANLIFQKFDDIVKLVKDPARPIQFVFAGKAHPRDDEGKRLIQQIIHLSKYSDLKGHLVFIENYDIHVARQMISGCDVWLNTPRRPLEASGTSGMKAGCHGCLNMSILDGWWREGYDGTNGFAIGEDSNPPSTVEQDKIDSENLYRVLTEDVIPCFYNRDANGIPRQWIKKIRRAMATLVPKFTTCRMVREYTLKYYIKEQQQSEA